MKIANTTEEFNRYCNSHIEKIRMLHGIGFKYIDISFYEDHMPGSEMLSENRYEIISEIKKYGEDNNIKYVQAHLPGGNFLSKDACYDTLLKSYINTIEACGILGIKNAVYHAGFAPDIIKDEFYKLNRDYINLLIPHLEEHNVNLCVENSCKSNLGKYYYFFSGKDLREFLDYVNHPNVTACWDTGHANIEGPQHDDILALSDKLTALHINDNNGLKDEHLLPYMGTMNIDEIMSALLEINYNGYFTFESGNTLNGGWPYKKREFEQSKKAFKPELEYKKIFVKAALTVGKNILTTYNCYED